jgi:hypothetical protein
VGDGSPPTVVPTGRRGSRGGSTWLSGVVAVKGIHQGEERGADAAHGAAGLTVVALPWIEPSLALAAASGVGGVVCRWHSQWRWVTGRNEHGGDVMVEP